MLVLTRKKQEVIQIGDNVFIKVLKVGQNSVKIGIAAPEDVRVLRAELAVEESTYATKETQEEVEPHTPLALGTAV